MARKTKKTQPKTKASNARAGLPARGLYPRRFDSRRVRVSPVIYDIVAQQQRLNYVSKQRHGDYKNSRNRSRSDSSSALQAKVLSEFSGANSSERISVSQRRNPWVDNRVVDAFRTRVCRERAARRAVLFSHGAIGRGSKKILRKAVWTSRSEVIC